MLAHPPNGAGRSPTNPRRFRQIPAGRGRLAGVATSPAGPSAGPEARRVVRWQRPAPCDGAARPTRSAGRVGCARERRATRIDRGPGRGEAPSGLRGAAQPARATPRRTCRRSAHRCSLGATPPADGSVAPPAVRGGIRPTEIRRRRWRFVGDQPAQRRRSTTAEIASVGLRARSQGRGRLRCRAPGSRVGRVTRGRRPAPRDPRTRAKSAIRDPRPRATRAARAGPNSCQIFPSPSLSGPRPHSGPHSFFLLFSVPCSASISIVVSYSSPLPPPLLTPFLSPRNGEKLSK